MLIRSVFGNRFIDVFVFFLLIIR